MRFSQANTPFCWAGPCRHAVTHTHLSIEGRRGPRGPPAGTVGGGAAAATAAARLPIQRAAPAPAAAPTGGAPLAAAAHVPVHGSFGAPAAHGQFLD